MPDIHTPQQVTEIPLAIVKSMVALATSGFGLVVALAWNEFIRKLVDTYIAPYFGQASGVASLFIYAVIVTIIAVLITMQLAILQRKIEQVQERVVNRRKQVTTVKK